MHKAVFVASASVAILVVSRPAAADSACCSNWETGQYASCTVQATPCQAGQVSVAIDSVDGGPGACPAGSQACLIVPSRSCCTVDCSGDATRCGAIAPQPLPSCCQGCCVDEHPELCMDPRVNACCLANAVLRSPPPSGESPEWVVSFGSATGPSDGAAPQTEPASEAGADAAGGGGGGSSGGSDGATGPSGAATDGAAAEASTSTFVITVPPQVPEGGDMESGGSGGCAATKPGGTRASWLLAAALGALAMRRRRR